MMALFLPGGHPEGLRPSWELFESMPLRAFKAAFANFEMAALAAPDIRVADQPPNPFFGPMLAYAWLSEVDDPQSPVDIFQIDYDPDYYPSVGDDPQD